MAGGPELYAQFFDNPGAINTGVNTGGPVRLPYAGKPASATTSAETVTSISTPVSPSPGNSPTTGPLKFTWEVYNVTNAVRFDPESIGSGLSDGNLGVANVELTVPRRMQFSLRYDF